jgi:hypothetical protein
MLMKNRPGERARHHLRTAQWSAAKSLKRPIAILAAVMIAGCVVIALLPTFPTAKAFFLGFLTAAFLVAVAWLVGVSSGSYGWSLGKMGEEFTAEAVVSSARHRQGWRLVNGLYFGGHGDVDHTVVGPGGVFVIESKFTTSPCRVAGGRVEGITGREPISQARKGASKVEKMLKYGRERFDVRVRPVVVIWGPGRVKMDQGWQMVDGVLLCDGPEHRRWLRELDGQVLDQELIGGIERLLGGYVEGQVTVDH